MTEPVLTREQIVETGHFLLCLQDSDGALPWFPHGQWDAWNHTEALMGLTVAAVVARGLHDGAAADFLDGAHRGLEHLRRTQRPDGSWPMLRRDGLVEHEESDTNQCAYPAVGVWHLFLSTGESTVLDTYWPMVRAALDHVVAAQLPSGAIAWAVNPRGRLGDHALLTGSASILQSLWAGHAIARFIDREKDAAAWVNAGNRLAAAVADRPEAFAPRDRHSMDWFYPILGGALTGERAWNHLLAEWDRYVWPGHGVRCVHDHPWVTGGETAELAMALACLVDQPFGPEAMSRARTVLQDISRLRTAGGGYWTGFVVDDDTMWPQEQTGWTAGAMLLAVDALDHLTPAHNLFHAMTWPKEHP